jgi:hypothetical protein
MSLYEVLTYGAWWFLFVALAILLAFLGDIPGMLIGYVFTVYLVGTIDIENARSMARPDYDFRMPFDVLPHAFWVIVLTAPFSYLAIRLRRKWGFWFPYWWLRRGKSAG